MLLLLAACQNEDEGANRETIQSHSIKSVIENNYRSTDESRTSVDEEGHVSWIETDRLGVFGTITQNACFTSSCTGTEVDFTGELSEGDKEIVCVYYPYDEDATFDNNSLTFTLPDDYTYTGNSHAPMLGVEQEDGSYLFKHLCGLMRVTVKGVPEGTSTFKVTSVGENALGIAGKARVADITSTDAVLSLEDEVIKTVAVTLETEEIMDATFYIPLPVGTYSQLSVTYSDDSKEYFTKTTSNVTIERGMLLDMPVLTAWDDDAVVENYLDKIDAYIQSLNEESYSSFKEKFVSWLEEQDYIEKLELVEGNNHDEYGVVFKNCYETSIGFIIQEPSVDARSNVDFARNLFYIPEVEDEIIKTNIKVKSYSFLELSEGDEQYEKSQEQVKQAFEDSPIKSFGNFYCLSNKKNVIQEFISDKKEEYGAILFTDTHGIGGGAFRVLEEENASYFGINDESKYHKIAPLYVKIPYIGTYLPPYKKIDCIAIKPAYLVEGDLINDDAILFGAYCWSANKYGNYSLFEHLKGNFLGYTKTIGAKLLVPEVVYYYSLLFNGETSENAYNYASNKGETGNLRHNNSSNRLQRYFSISTNELKHGTEVAQSISVTGKLNGYKNLKSSIKPVVYWKKGTEPFSSPLEEGIEKGYYKEKGSNEYKHPHDNIGKFLHYNGQYDIILENLEMYTTYQVAIGFEYTTNGQTKYYWGDVKELTTGGDPDREALIELYNTHQGENWENIKNWCTTDTKLYTWTGVETKILEGEERVTKLTLDVNTRLTGELDLTKFTYLNALWIRNVDLSLLNVSNLLYLKCINKYGFDFKPKDSDIIQELDASGCISLEDMYIPDNTDFINISGCKSYSKYTLFSGGNNVRRVDASDCNFSSVHIEEIKNIKELILRNCNNILGFNGNTSIETIDLSGCVKLKELECNKSNLKSLNLSNCSELSYFYCRNTQLLDLNLTNCSKLRYFYCDDNQLVNLVGINSCESLSYFYLNNTNLTSLNVSGLSKLTSFECNNSNLNSLNVNGCTNLESISIYGNSFSHLNLSSSEKLKTLVASNNPLVGTLDLSKNVLIGHVDIQNTNLSTLNIDTKMRGASGIEVLAKGTKLKDVYVHNRVQLLPFDYVLFNYQWEFWGDLLEKRNIDSDFSLRHCRVKKEEYRDEHDWLVTVYYYSQYPEIHFDCNNDSEPYVYYHGK